MTGILGRKYDGGDKDSKDKTCFIKLSQTEYDEMKMRIKALEDENTSLKQQLENK